MADTRSQSILHYLRKALGTPTSGVTDAELLRRFVRERDEAAFELLLWRHAAMVLHVCRHVLRDSDTAEDAFQATFLVFVRKAACIRHGGQLGGWLYRVAYHTALKAREQSTRRQSAEKQAVQLDTHSLVPEDAEQGEMRRMICEEVNRLPTRYRTAIVACFFEGKTHEQAAEQLGWPRGTVASRLTRARELLRRRLVRRGVTLTTGALITALPLPASQAALLGLVRVTVQWGRQVAAGAMVPPRVALLVEGVLKTMYHSQMKTLMAILLLSLLSGAGAILLASPRGDSEPSQAAPEAKKAKTEKTVVQNMAQSRLNLKKLALAMITYADSHKGKMLPPAVPGKDGKYLLSWRVLLLPSLGEQELYEQFKLSEPWDSPHNKKLLGRMPSVYAPPGATPREPFSTYYQVFVSPKPKKGEVPQEEAATGGAGGVPAVPVTQAAFVEGRPQLYPAHFIDGTSNTILIVEAGHAVPWTKPEDLPYAPNKPVPELGGLFHDVFHAVFADGHVETLTTKIDEYNLRCIITSNGGEVYQSDSIQGRSSAADWRRKNRELEQELDDARERLRRLQQERDVLLGRAVEINSDDARVDELKKEHERLRKEMEKVAEESKTLYEETHSLLQKPKEKKPAPDK